jgi:hypothetical protein
LLADLHLEIVALIAAHWTTFAQSDSGVLVVLTLPAVVRPSPLVAMILSLMPSHLELPKT